MAKTTDLKAPAPPKKAKEKAKKQSAVKSEGKVVDGVLHLTLEIPVGDPTVSKSGKSAVLFRQPRNDHSIVDGISIGGQEVKLCGICLYSPFAKEEEEEEK